MLLRDYLPGPEVSDLVQCYRIVHLKFDQPGNIPFKVYPPKPEQCLHFFLGDFFAIQKAGDEMEVQPSVLLTGQRTTLVKQHTGRNFIDVQIVFQPSGLFRLTGISAYELCNQHLDATGFFSNYIMVVQEQLRSAKTYTEMLHIVDNFSKRLSRQLCKEAVPLDAVSRQMKFGTINYSIDDLAKWSFLSKKQFERKFNERVGVNPKTYSKIIRFNRVFNMKNRYPRKSWSAIAIACGYYDYQHLAKDYKDFTGLTPSELHLLETNSPECVLGLAKELYHARYRLAY